MESHHAPAAYADTRGGMICVGAPALPRPFLTRPESGPLMCGVVGGGADPAILARGPSERGQSFFSGAVVAYCSRCRSQQLGSSSDDGWGEACTPLRWRSWSAMLCPALPGPAPVVEPEAACFVQRRQRQRRAREELWSFE